MSLYLTIAALQAHRACYIDAETGAWRTIEGRTFLDAHLADLRRVLPEVTDDQPVPLRVWWDLPSTSVTDRLRWLQAAEPRLPALILGVRAGCLITRRVLHLMQDQDRLVCEEAIKAVEAWAANPNKETWRAAKRATCSGAFQAAVRAERAAYCYEYSAASRAEREHRRTDLDRLLAEVSS